MTATQVDSRSKVTEIGTLGSRFSHTSSRNWEVRYRTPGSSAAMISRPIRKPWSVGSPTNRPTQRSPSATRGPQFLEIDPGLGAIWPQGRSGYIAYEYIGGLTGAHRNRFEAGFRIEF